MKRVFSLLLIALLAGGAGAAGAATKKKKKPKKPYSYDDSKYKARVETANVYRFDAEGKPILPGAKKKKPAKKKGKAKSPIKGMDAAEGVKPPEPKPAQAPQRPNEIKVNDDTPIGGPDNEL